MKAKFLSVDDLFILLIYIMRFCSEKLYVQNLQQKTRMFNFESFPRKKCVQGHKSSKHKNSFTLNGGIRRTPTTKYMTRRRYKVPFSKNGVYSALGIQDVTRQCPSHRIILYPLGGEDTPPKNLDQFFNERQTYFNSMNIEMIRLETFKQFPTSLDVSPIRLAETGFFYTGNGESVQCFSCGVIYEDWVDNEDPNVVHQRISPLCMHVRNQDMNNVPIYRNHSIRPDLQRRNIGLTLMSDLLASNGGGKTSTNDRLLNSSTRSTSQRGQKKRPVSESCATVHENNITSTSHRIVSSASSLASVGSYHNSALTQLQWPSASGRNEEYTKQTVQTEEMQMSSDHTNAKMLRRESEVHSLNPVGITSDIPRYPAYADKSVRINSFKKWPSNKSQTPIELSSAGFFYAGFGDCVRCFYCGGGLKEWDSEDDPWMEHARWFPKCTFLIENKGNEFVNLVQTEFEKRTSTGDTDDNDTGCDEEEETIMDSPAVKSVMEMGYTLEDISQALRKSGFFNKGGDLTAVKILDILMEEENNEDERKMASGSKNTESCQCSYHDSERRCMVEEIQQLRHERLCKVCLDQVANFVILPCAHLCCCDECVPHLNTCPICRLIIKGTVRVWLS